MRAWHTFFAQILRKHLSSAGFEVLSEVQVGKLPLRIDLVVIKAVKSIDYSSISSVFRFFRNWNLLEFKSPQDRFERGDLHKLQAYGHLYILKEKILSQECVTLSIVVSEVSSRDRFFFEDIGFKLISPGLLQRFGEFLISVIIIGDLPVDRENLPFLFFSKGPKRREFLREIILKREKEYIELSLEFYSEELMEVLEMIELSPEELSEMGVNFDALAKLLIWMDKRKYVEALGIKEMVEAVGIEKTIESIGIEKTIESIGIEKTIEALGVERIEEILKKIKKKRGNNT